jgi:hypothetical protein
MRKDYEEINYEAIIEAIEYLEHRVEFYCIFKRLNEIKEAKKHLDIDAEFDAMRRMDGSASMDVVFTSMEYESERGELLKRAKTISERRDATAYLREKNRYIAFISSIEVYDISNIHEVKNGLSRLENELTQLKAMRDNHPEYKEEQYNSLVLRFEKAKSQESGGNERLSSFYRRMESEFDSLSGGFKNISGHTDAVLKAVECDSFAAEFKAKQAEASLRETLDSLMERVESLTKSPASTSLDFNNKALEWENLEKEYSAIKNNSVAAKCADLCERNKLNNRKQYEIALAGENKKGLVAKWVTAFCALLQIGLIVAYFNMLWTSTESMKLTAPEYFEIFSWDTLVGLANMSISFGIFILAICVIGTLMVRKLPDNGIDNIALFNFLAVPGMGIAHAVIVGIQASGGYFLYGVVIGVATLILAAIAILPGGIFIFVRLEAKGRIALAIVVFVLLLTLGIFYGFADFWESLLSFNFIPRNQNYLNGGNMYVNTV